MAENNENEQDQTTIPAAGTSEASATNTAKTVKEKTPTQLLKEERIKEVEAALKSFPTLKEGFVTPRGVYFDEKSALASVDDEEELVTKVLPSKK